MQQRLNAFAKAFRVSIASRLPLMPDASLKISQRICRACRKKFSTSPTLRLFGRATQPVEKERKYSSRLLVYAAGDARTDWVAFWKGVALLQCGTTFVFAVPPLWKDESQPDVRLRHARAILVGILGTIPTLTLAYVTAPFTHQVFLQIPEYARRSQHDLMRFVNDVVKKPTATANTKLEFTTLRVWPFRKHTAAFIHELRALPPRRLRLANIELPKDAAWAERQRRKGILQRMFEVINEPRYKFYVKEGRKYTIKTGVPGVWEAVVQRIHDQTIEAAGSEPKPRIGMRRPPVAPRPPTIGLTQEKVKRQTARARGR